MPLNPEAQDLKSQVDIGQIITQELGYTFDEKASRGSDWKVYKHGPHGCLLASHDRQLYKNDNGDATDRGDVFNLLISHGLAHNFGSAKDWLKAYVGNGCNTPRRPETARIEKLSASEMTKIWNNMTGYLGEYLQSRGISDRTIDLFADHIKLDHAGWVSFGHATHPGNPHVTGWDRINPVDDREKGFSRGGERNLAWLSPRDDRMSDPSRIIVTESALDALSYYQLNSPPSGSILAATGGSMTGKQADMITAEAGRYLIPVIVATDNDENGRAYEQMLRERIPARMFLAHRPDNGVKDWNDELQRIQKLMDQQDNTPAPAQLPGM